MSIEVNIAIQKHRVSVAEKLIDSLNKQTVKPDLITLILQGFKHEFKSDIELNYVYNSENKGSAERLKHTGDGINLIIDDDFVPYPNYIEVALQGLERNANAFCSFWGYQVIKANTWTKGIHNIDCYKKYYQDIKCKMLGVGLSIWDESKLRLKDVAFEYSNYVDIQLGVYCKVNNIDMFKLAQPLKLVKHYDNAEIQQGSLYKGQASNSKLFQSEYLKIISDEK